MTIALNLFIHLIRLLKIVTFVRIQLRFDCCLDNDCISFFLNLIFSIRFWATDGDSFRKIKFFLLNHHLSKFFLYANLKLIECYASCFEFYLKCYFWIFIFIEYFYKSIAGNRVIHETDFRHIFDVF